MNRISIPVLLSISLFLSTTSAADCQQSRGSGDPSGDDISTALTKNNQLDEVCSGKFPPGNDTYNTFNHWSMDYTVSRDDASQPLQDCNDAFNDIISHCISGGNYWGGTWSLNGFTYSIYNSIYGQQPDNPLAPSDAGRPSSGPSSTATSTGTPGSSSSGVSVSTGASTTAQGESSTGAAGSTTRAPNSNVQDTSTTTDSGPASTAAPVAGQTIITETDASGSTVTETFIPTTLTQFSTLSSTTTITTTTTSDGTPIPFPWVIGPGGVAFIPPPGVPLPPGVFPPPIVPDGGDGGNSNDPTPSNSQVSKSASKTATSTATTSTAACSDIVFGPPAGLDDQVPFTPAWVTSSIPVTTSHPPSTTTPPTTTTSPISSTPLPAPRTITTNGAVCVLLPESVDPHCEPLSGAQVTTTAPKPTSTAAPAPSNYPGCNVSVEGFTCDQKCRGYVPCQPWCVAECGYCFNAHNVC